MLYRVYMDEAGDPGYPQRSTNLFVLTSLYMKDRDWEDNYKTVRRFRVNLDQKCGFPEGVELHTNHLLRKKHPYRQLGWSNAEIIEIIEKFFDLITRLDLKIINVCINKLRADERDYVDEEEYDVLEKGMTYSVQRLDNDTTNKDYFVITIDEGRSTQMAKVANRMEENNRIPSKFQDGYRKDMEIDKLIEEPRSKSSDKSEFIQLADAVATMLLLHMRQKLIKEMNVQGIKQKLRWSNRIKDKLNYGKPERLLEKISSELNLKASSNSNLGIVHYPK